MNARMKVNAGKTAMRVAQAAVLAMLVVSQPQAQTNDGTIARLREVNGNVLVSNASGLSSGDEALRLQPGTRVITTANAEVIVEYDNGCKVRLKENQRFEVEKDKPCALLVAQPYSILLTPEGALAAAAGVVAVVAPAFVGIASVAVLVDSRTKTTVSPS